MFIFSVFTSNPATKNNHHISLVPRPGKLARHKTYLSLILDFRYHHCATHFVFELLAELQGDGEEDQRVVQPGHHALHLMDVAHLKAVVVQLAG